MKEKEAQSILKSVFSISEEMNKFYEILNELENHDEKKELIKLLLEMMANVSSHFLYPVVKQFPELDPDREYLEQKRIEREDE